MNIDLRMMRRADELARTALYSSDPNPRVGCVVAQGDDVVGEGFTDPVGGPHAEVNALRAAGDKARGATAFVTLEPCSHHGRTPPCTDALIAAGVRRVVYAVGDPNPKVNGAGVAALRAAGIEVAVGPLAAKTRELNIGFFKRMTTGLPWVTVKLGSSLDGKVALANGASQWITGAAARMDVQRQRARSSAIVTGIGTVLADDPRLTVRAADIDMRGRRPLRVVCDSQLRTPRTARLLIEGGTVVLAASDDQARTESLRAAGAEVVQAGSGQVDLLAMLKLLAARECNEILVEAGPTLSGRFLAQGLVDELLIYMAPTVLGSQAQSMLALPSIDKLDASWKFALHDCERVGEDLRLRFRMPPIPSAKAEDK